MEFGLHCSIKTVCSSRNNSRCHFCHSLGHKLSHGIGYIWLQEWKGTFSREKRLVEHGNSSWPLLQKAVSLIAHCKGLAWALSPWGALCSCGPPTLVQRLPGADPMSPSPWLPLYFQTCTPIPCKLPVGHDVLFPLSSEWPSLLLLRLFLLAHRNCPVCKIAIFSALVCTYPPIISFCKSLPTMSLN